ncbi:MAG: hypothetical protein NW215_11710 [Hyphomicrobiales bacterium]|nr:hypothetical protein [Hyphomicrobiales bacterium]
MAARWITVLAAAAVMGGVESASASELFKRLDGSWKGSGVVRLEGGNERISCRGYYNARGGASLSIALRCAAPSYRIEMRSNVTESDGRITGRWEERTFNAEGSLSGRATATSVNLAISGVITGSMTIAVGGAGHQVNLTASGPRFRGVSISLTRG